MEGCKLILLIGLVRPIRDYVMYWPNEERCAPQQIYYDMGRSRGMAILRGATCPARHYHTRTLGYTTWRWQGIYTYTLIFPHHLLPAQYPCKLTDFFPFQNSRVRGLWLSVAFGCRQLSRGNTMLPTLG